MGGPSLSTRARVPLWDTTRFIAITLVVVGHAIQRLIADSDTALVVYLFIYAFHMPLFALISGYFSKPGPPTERRMQRVITDILIPYLIFETIWTVVQAVVEGSGTLNPTRPSWTLWFLLALGIFRLVLPYLALVRWPLLWAVLISVGVGYFDNVGATFSLARALGILPFFVLGWKLHDWGLIERWRVASPPTLIVRTAAVLVLAAWLAVLIAFIDVWRAIELRYWFFYDESYTGLGVDDWWASLVRLALIGTAHLPAPRRAAAALAVPTRSGCAHRPAAGPALAHRPDGLAPRPAALTDRRCSPADRQVTACVTPRCRTRGPGVPFEAFHRPTRRPP